MILTKNKERASKISTIAFLKIISLKILTIANQLQKIMCKIIKLHNYKILNI